jgi:hypothetical protein
MMPTAIAGVKPWNGKKNPVTLVATVVNRKNEVQWSRRLLVSNPNITTSPERIATRLIAT